MIKIVLLSEWARMLKKPISRERARQLAEAGNRIKPPPYKYGGHWYIESRATYKHLKRGRPKLKVIKYDNE